MLFPGQLVAGRYRLKRLLGTGGMGAVWLADHVDLDAPVAVKFQHATLSGDSGAGERFLREAKVAARLRSPHVVRIQDYGVDSGVAFMAMELLEGESLRARLDREERVTPRETARVLRQAAAGLDVAHASGVVHRDVKPSNLFLTREGDTEVVKLLDFGIAKWSEAEGDPTASSVVLGSARYLSPEQARGEKVDARSDIWSLGVVAYEMLVGEAPFHGANLPDTTTRICSGKFEKPSARLGASYACFDSLFQRALALSPSARPASASELADAFARAADDWKGSGLSTLGRASDTATMRATVTAQTSLGTRRSGAVLIGITGFLAVSAAALWQIRRGDDESDRATPVEKSSSAAATTASQAPAATNAPAAAQSPSPSVLAPAAPSATATPTAAASAGAPVRATVTPRTRAARPPAVPARRDAGQPEKTSEPAPVPKPPRSTDPDFGLILPGK